MSCIAIHDVLGVVRNIRQKNFLKQIFCDAAHIKSRTSKYRELYETSAGGDRWTERTRRTVWAGLAQDAFVQQRDPEAQGRSRRLSWAQPGQYKEIVIPRRGFLCLASFIGLTAVLIVAVTAPVYWLLDKLGVPEWLQYWMLAILIVAGFYLAERLFRHEPIDRRQFLQLSLCFAIALTVIHVML